MVNMVFQPGHFFHSPLHRLPNFSQVLTHTVHALVKSQSFTICPSPAGPVTYSRWGPPPINVRKSVTVVGWCRLIDRVYAGFLGDLLKGLRLLECRALPERVERLLARGLLRVGDVCWGLGVSAASPMASATASSPRVLIRWWLARLRVVGVTPSLELGAVAFDVPRGLAVVTGGRLIARIRMCGAGGNVVAAVGASVVADPAALLARVVRGSGLPAVGGGCSPPDLADAHRFGCGLR